MDAKTRADFINSVANGKKIPCPVCDSLNEPDSIFCMSCGSKLNADNFSEQKQPHNVLGKQDFQQAVKKDESVKSVFKNVNTVPVAEPEEISAFAQGLPAWDIVPPQVMVRRKKKK